MHRTVTITAPAQTTDALTQALLDLPGVVSLAVHRGASRKPLGDSVVVQCLNREVDAVLRQARAGYAALALAAARVVGALVAANAVTVERLVGGPAVSSLTRPTPADLLVSTGGALAGVTMIAAYRRDTIAGALMALMVVPAAA